MAHVSHKSSNSLEGALAGGGVAAVTFGPAVWLVVFTIAMVSAMYRLWPQCKTNVPRSEHR